MNLENLKAQGIEPYIMIDTSDFMRYCINKYGYTNGSWHKVIWHKCGMCESILNNGGNTQYSRTKKPENVLDEHVNDFLNDFPELEDRVTFIFTN